MTSSLSPAFRHLATALILCVAVAATACTGESDSSVDTDQRPQIEANLAAVQDDARERFEQTSQQVDEPSQPLEVIKSNQNNDDPSEPR